MHGLTYAILPVKGFERGKSRLAPTLTPAARRALATALFERALQACTRCTAIDHVVIASDEHEAFMRGQRMGASALPDPVPRVPFASVLDRALAHAHAQGALRALIVMADLPWVQPRDLSELIAALDRHPTDAHPLVIAPDQNRRGIGALACVLPAPLPMQLGHRDSLARTLEQARKLALHVSLVRNPRLARDIDTAADLAGSVRAGLTVG